MPKLQPCPFCGSTNVEYKLMLGCYQRVFCHNCKTDIYFDIDLSQEKAIELYNTRVEKSVNIQQNADLFPVRW